LPHEAGAARRDFLGPTWDSPIRGLRLQPGTTGRPDEAPSGTRSPWRTRTVIESGHWKARGLGLLILCSSASDTTARGFLRAARLARWRDVCLAQVHSRRPGYLSGRTYASQPPKSGLHREHASLLPPRG